MFVGRYARSGFFGSINHDTYDAHENVAYSVAFRTFDQMARVLTNDTIRAFAFQKCLQRLDGFIILRAISPNIITGLMAF